MQYPNFDGTQLCAQVDRELFFPDNDNESDFQHPVKMVKALCDQCHFKTECLEYALGYKLQGIWGGLTEGERAKLARKRGISRQTVLKEEHLPFVEHPDPEIALARRIRRENKRAQRTRLAASSGAA